MIGLSKRQRYTDIMAETSSDTQRAAVKGLRSVLDTNLKLVDTLLDNSKKANEAGHQEEADELLESAKTLLESSKQLYGAIKKLDEAG
jgi:hypothetical protein